MLFCVICEHVVVHNTHPQRFVLNLSQFCMKLKYIFQALLCLSFCCEAGVCLFLSPCTGSTAQASRAGKSHFTVFYTVRSEWVFEARA